jgi:tRNA-dihydrouridine synthase A
MTLIKSNRTKSKIQSSARFSVAPMMDWTDRHCRYFHRKFTNRSLLYTEMVAAAALVQGKAYHLLDYSNEEHPLALQLGGSDPIQLAEAASIGQSRGYDEINLNVGCPSDRVQSGSFGAVLMKNPKLVAACCEAMKKNTSVDITVKCRIGVDDQDPEQILPEFLNHISNSGVSRVIIHARKAILKGLSPKENRDIPPLDYEIVFKMKEKFPNLHISLNGGVTSLSAANDLLAKGIDGVMIGRSAYQQPMQILSEVDKNIFDEKVISSPFDIADAMRPYLKEHCEKGGKPHQVTRHMIGLFHGLPGAKTWRQYLSNTSLHKNIDFYDEALAAVSESSNKSAA